MGFFNWPFSNLHELNLDWIIEKLQNLLHMNVHTYVSTNQNGSYDEETNTMHIPIMPGPQGPQGPQGQPGADGVQINDSTASLTTAYSGTKIDNLIAACIAAADEPGGAGYKKFYDGTLLCWGEFSLPSATFNAWGSLYYYRYSVTVNFPTTFISTPNVSFSCPYDAAFLNLNYAANASIIYRVGVVRNNANAPEYQRISYIAIGRWK